MSEIALRAQATGGLRTARIFVQHAIDFEEKIAEPHHVALATSYHNMAGIAFAEGKPREAFEWEEKAMAIWRKHFDENHPHVKISEQGLAKYRKAVADAGA